MKRQWNWRIWTGFLLVLAGFVSFPLLFIHYPITRDFPWANLLMFAAGLALLGAGLFRAYRKPDVYRGRIVGAAFTLIAVLGVSLFVYGVFIFARQLPASGSAPQVGQKAPDFTLPDQDSNPLALADLLLNAGANAAKANGALLIFYRGHW